MTAVVLVAITLTVIGLPVALAIDEALRPLSAIALGFLYGSGVTWAVMLALSPFGWTLPRVAAAMLMVSGVCLAIAMRRRTGGANLRLALPDALTAIVLAGFACFATLAPLWDWDFWAIWGLKARIFIEHGAIDWRFLQSPWNSFSHPDYPLLVPLNMSLAALANGGWDDRWLGVLFVAFAAAIVLLVRDLAAQEASPNVGACIALAIASTACVRRAGIAEGPLIAFGGGALLMLRRALLFGDRPAWRHGALLLGLAACTKNEGLVLLGTVAAALVLSGAARQVWRLWPAFALALPWLVLRVVYRLPSDVVSGSLDARVAAHLPQLGVILRELDEHLVTPWLFVAILFAILVGRERSRERFVLLAVAMQLAMDFATYLVTPNDLVWHIATSWDRVSAQFLVPLTYAAAMLVARSFDTLPGHAEARPDL